MRNLGNTITLVVILGCSACTGIGARGDTSLYQDLGGQAGIARIVDAFIARLADDPLVVNTFADTDMAEFHHHLSDQLCHLAGGGCEYTGRTMVEAHEGMEVEPRQFNALVEDLMQAMEDVGVAQGSQNRLLGLLAPMYGDMVVNPNVSDRIDPPLTHPLN